MRIPVTNNTQMPIYVGAYMIPPGETRDFDESQVPAHLRPAPPAPEPEAPPAEDPLAAIREQSVADIVELLPALSDDELARLGDLEQIQANPRKTLLAALAEEQLKRAEATAGGAA